MPIRRPTPRNSPDLRGHRQAKVDNPPRIWNGRRSELVQRLLAEVCELCGSTEQVEVHHIKALKDLNLKGRKQQSEWVTRMASRRRKTLGDDFVRRGRPVERRGDGGFGYGSIFVPAGSNLTFVEMSAEQKNTISHRRLAVDALREAFGISGS